ncbi:MAG: addiction module antitoxin RelB [Burkholderiales bacterium]|nr:addiction module antitoxin RelB [Burkholderiales bacterium]
MPEDRSRLIDPLLVSLHEEPLAEGEAAWNEADESRLSAHDRRELELVDSEDVLAEARRIAQ